VKKLSINEEIFLLAIWFLADEAYGVKIQKKIRKITGHTFLFGTLYNTLDNLVKKGYVHTWKGEATPQRGGNNKVFYALTKDGRLALQKARELHDSLWAGVPRNAFNR
jgi:DNA-binding PadR family transcriptional regulator